MAKDEVTDALLEEARLYFRHFLGSLESEEQLRGGLTQPKRDHISQLRAAQHVLVHLAHRYCSKEYNILFRRIIETIAHIANL